MGITIQQTHYEPIPAGTYSAKFATVEQTTGQFGDQIKFKLELPPDEEGESRSLIAWASMKFSPKSKLYEWAKAAIFEGGDIPLDYNIDCDEFLGKKVRIVVTEADKDGTIINKIVQLLPYKSATSVKPVSSPPADW
ncbi:MAG: hypothetical protein WAV05_07050 [Anaerolineales bacterium]